MPDLDAVPTMHAYSGRLLPRPRDWGAHHQIIGPALPTPELAEALDPGRRSAELLDWVRGGPPVVYVGLGSMPVLDPQAALDLVASATANLGLRALVAEGSSDYGAAAVPEHLRVVRGPVDHEALLAECVAAVHHGGSGTTASVTRAGIPSVVLSVFLDQPFWGWRLEQNGLGVGMPFRRVTRERLVKALREVVQPDHRARARAFAAVLRAEDGATSAVDILERTVRERHRH